MVQKTTDWALRSRGSALGPVATLSGKGYDGCPEEQGISPGPRGPSEHTSPNGVLTSLVLSDPSVEQGDGSQALELPCAELETKYKLLRQGGVASTVAQQVAPGKGDIPWIVLKTDTPGHSEGAASGGLRAWEDPRQAPVEAKDQGAPRGKLEPADCRRDGGRPRSIQEGLVPGPLPLHREPACGAVSATRHSARVPTCCSTSECTRVGGPVNTRSATEPSTGTPTSWSTSTHTGAAPHLPGLGQGLQPELQPGRAPEDTWGLAAARSCTPVPTGSRPSCTWPACGSTSAHIGKRPFERTRCSLAEHRCRQTGEWPYTCRVCSRSFGHRSNLNEHRERHAGGSTP
ncbi:zinc finger protein 497-like [Panthera uncia]|uniref:zinc finger protein 497-like n=1 Tax=Panthera uncia TaxID=29064 RepID=UPI0020FFB931|nr:zinc finger protein 497-like [Panthera uncia]